MVFSLEDFDTLLLPNNIQKTPPTSPTDSPENHPNPPSNTEATGEPASQQNTTHPTPALDPILLAHSSQTPNPTANPVLHGEDLTQFARHLALQKSLSKHSADELVVFTKRPLGEQLIWLAASQLSLNDAVLSVFCGEISPTLMKHVKQEVGKHILSPVLPAYRNEQLGYDMIKDALLADPTADISQETLKDIDFCKKLKSAILTAWTKARSAIKTEVQYQDLFCVAELNHIKTQIAQSLGDDPNSELNEGVPNRRPSSVDILQLSAKILQSVPGAKNVKPSVALARYCYTLSQSSAEDYWGLVDKTLEEIRKTLKDSSAISQKFAKVFTVDRCMYGTADEANQQLTNSAPLSRRTSGSAVVAGSKRKRS